MRRLLACLLLIAGPATAAPAYVYDFVTTAPFACPLPDNPANAPECASAEAYVAGLLDTLGIVISHDAAIAGFASLHLFHGPHTELDNSGVLAVTIPNHAPIDLADLSNLSGPFGLNFAVDVGLLLRGAYNFGNSQESLYMASGNSTTWLGAIQADRFSWSGGSPLAFEGEWRLVQIVPEPGALVLLLIALAAIGLHKREKARPGQAFA